MFADYESTDDKCQSKKIYRAGDYLPCSLLCYILPIAEKFDCEAVGFDLVSEDGRPEGVTAYNRSVDIDFVNISDTVAVSAVVRKDVYPGGGIGIHGLARIILNVFLHCIGADFNSCNLDFLGAGSAASEITVIDAAAPDGAR